METTNLAEEGPSTASVFIKKTTTSKKKESTRERPPCPKQWSREGAYHPSGPYHQQAQRHQEINPKLTPPAPIKEQLSALRKTAPVSPAGTNCHSVTSQSANLHVAWNGLEGPNREVSPPSWQKSEKSDQAIIWPSPGVWSSPSRNLPWDLAGFPIHP